MASAIADYLDRLDGELRLQRAPRRRLLAEVEDHLRSSALETGGDVCEHEAERAAVERFGAAATVARRFAHTVAATSARRSVGRLGVAFAAYVAASAAFMATADPQFADFPQGAPSALALQIAAVAVAVSLIRSRRWRDSALVPDDRIRFLANGAAIGATSLALGLLFEAIVAATRPAGVLPWDGFHSSPPCSRSRLSQRWSPPFRQPRPPSVARRSPRCRERRTATARCRGSSMTLVGWCRRRVGSLLQRSRDPGLSSVASLRAPSRPSS